MTADVLFEDGHVVITLPLDRKMTDVIRAATKVCNVRYSDAEWHEVDAAIGELIHALKVLGVEFHNPRIR